MKVKYDNESESIHSNRNYGVALWTWEGTELNVFDKGDDIRISLEEHKMWRRVSEDAFLTLTHRRDDADSI